jgi:hypothetical protein
VLLVPAVVFLLVLINDNGVANVAIELLFIVLDGLIDYGYASLTRSFSLSCVATE